MNLLDYLKIPVVQVLFLAVPMIFVLDSPAMHKAVGSRFTKIAVRMLPLALALATIIGFVHPLGFGMGVAILIPYFQWASLKWLYMRFCRKRGRRPRVAVEREDVGDYDAGEVGFRMSTNVAVVGFPAVIVTVCFWLATDGHKFFA
jgi:hypothetical protein